MAHSNLDDQKIDFLNSHPFPDSCHGSSLVADTAEVVRNSRLARQGENRMAAGVEDPAKRARALGEVVPSFPLMVGVARPGNY